MAGRLTLRAMSVGVAAVIAAAGLAGVPSSGVATTLPEPGTYAGQGFDACSAPSAGTMQAWSASPYRAVGIYVGGINRACTQPQLTSAWVTDRQAEGWHLLPVYLGLQATCTTSNKKFLIDPARAVAQGREEADAAVRAAQALGLPRNTTLFFDMEAYATDDAACSRNVLGFLGAWTSRLHDLGYVSGAYGSMGSTVRDLVDDYRSTTRPHPDYLWFARYDGNATTSNDAIPADYWSPHRRLHQYRGGHDETYGGVTANVDNDYVDVRPLPSSRFGDFTGNGWGDLLGRDRSTGSLFLYPGNGTNLEARTGLGTGWNKLDAITRFGDFNGDGHEDVIARESATGYLWLYPGTGSGFGPRTRIGTGWGSMREITAVGDLDGDQRPDLLAVAKSTGNLYLYPGRGTGFGPRTLIGSGWGSMSELTGIGDLTGDGRRDLLARQSSTGTLFLYPGKAVGFAPRVSLGTGWSGRRSLVGVGDFNRDDHPDLMAIDSSTGSLYLYPGRTAGLSARILLSTGWSERGPLL